MTVTKRLVWGGSAAAFTVITTVVVAFSHDPLQTLRICLAVGVSTLGLVGYVPYYASIAKGLTKPHPVSWLVWAVLDGIAFFGQLSVHAGPGLWLTGITSFMCGLTGLIGVVLARRGALRVDRGDWLSLFGAAVALTLMLTLSNPLVAMILGQLVTWAGFVPTIRKVKAYPASEDVEIYWIADVKYALAIPALTTFDVTSLLWPVCGLVMHGYMTWLIRHENRATTDRSECDLPLLLLRTRWLNRPLHNVRSPCLSPSPESGGEGAAPHVRGGPGVCDAPVAAGQEPHPNPRTRQHGAVTRSR